VSMRTQRFDNRQSMKNKQFEIFHYREAKPGAVSVHHHDFYEIYFLLGGEVSYWIEGKTYHLNQGDLLLLNPQQLHQPLVLPGSPYERIVLWIDRSYLAGLCSDGTDLMSCFGSEAPEHANLLRPPVVVRQKIRELLELLNREYYSQEFGSARYGEGLFFQLMVEVNRLARQETLPEKQADTPDLVSQVVSYINSHSQENITLEQLAGMFYVSKYHLAHTFTRQTGTSVYKYITLKRLMQARELMALGQTPGEVYKACGFGDYANFYRAFKSEYGISPKEFASGSL